MGAGDVVVVGGGVVVADGFGARLACVRVGLAEAFADMLGLGVGDADWLIVAKVPTVTLGEGVALW